MHHITGLSWKLGHRSPVPGVVCAHPRGPSPDPREPEDQHIDIPTQGACGWVLNVPSWPVSLLASGQEGEERWKSWGALLTPEESACPGFSPSAPPFTTTPNSTGVSLSWPHPSLTSRPPQEVSHQPTLSPTPPSHLPRPPPPGLPPGQGVRPGGALGPPRRSPRGARAAAPTGSPRGTPRSHRR